MPIAIALIRGINVGGKNMLPMADLRTLCEKAGLADARTYIQSGNVVFRAGAREIGKAAGVLEAAIEQKAGFRPSVVVRTLEQWRGAIEANPFKSRRGLDDSRLLVMFLAKRAGADARKAVGALKSDPEEVRLRETEAYLNSPNGVAESNVSMATIERAIGVPGTCRNWRTVGVLLKMAEELEGAAKKG